MPPERSFRVLREQGDHVSLRQLASIALACAGLGLGVSGAADRFVPARPGAHNRESAAALSSTAIASSPPLAAAALPIPWLLAESLTQQPSAALDPGAGASAQRAPGTAAAHATRARHGRLKLERDRVSYLRCPERADSHSCAHVRALELHVWRALRGLSACYETPAHPGSAELRLELHRHRTPAIAFLAPETGPSLNLRAVRRCVEPQLSKLSNTIAREPLLVSFRFGLR